jgi:ATP-binding cassette subfamily B protein
MNENKNQENKIEPFYRLVQMLTEEKENLVVFLVYAVIISVLYLALPLSAQILVNTIAAGVLIQPLIVISLVVLLGLFFLGILKLLQLYIGEIIQRKIFIKISLDMSKRIPQIQQKYFGNIYAPELINRFFDTVTLQKTLNLILLEVPAAVLQIIIGLILMAFYSPILLVFDSLMLVSIIIIVTLGLKGLTTSIKESSSKYKVAHWLEEVARCQISFKMSCRPGYPTEIMDQRNLDYLNNRKAHFRVLLRQFSAGYVIQAFGTAGVLSIGGWLVINGQLSLGQLVASELIILMILSALDKIIQKLESWYDLLTALDKVNIINLLDLERTNGIKAKSNAQGAEIICEDIIFGYKPERKIFEKLNLHLESGSRTSLVGISGAGKTTLAYLITGLYDAQEGNILFNGSPIKSLLLTDLRKNIALVSDFNEIFAGTVEENILLGRAYLTEDDLRRVIDLVELERDLKQYPNGLQTELLSEGRNISLGQRQRILLARSIIDNPQLLILDEAFGGMDEMTKLKIIDKLFEKSQPWTILNITHDAEVVLKTDFVYLLEKGQVLEQGLLNDLIGNPESKFSRLFPELARIKLKEMI